MDLKSKQKKISLAKLLKQSVKRKLLYLYDNNKKINKCQEKKFDILLV